MPVSEETAKEIQRLLETPTPLLDSLERQRQYLAKTFSTHKTCPWQDCDAHPTVFDAAPATWTFGDSIPDDSYTCPACGGGLVFVLPVFLGTWVWEIDRNR